MEHDFEVTGLNFDSDEYCRLCGVVYPNEKPCIGKKEAERQWNARIMQKEIREERIERSPDIIDKALGFINSKMKVDPIIAMDGGRESEPFLDVLEVMELKSILEEKNEK